MPSTLISNTRSAWLIPECGLALGWLSILTASSLLWSRVGSATGRPLTGDRVGTAVVVVANDEVVVDEDVVVDEVVVSITSAGEQAATINMNTTNLLKVERIGGRVSLPAGYTVNTPPVIGRLGSAVSGSSIEIASSIPSALDRST
jgi:hypothetical protein